MQKQTKKIMNSSDVAKFEELSELEFTHYAGVSVSGFF